MKYEQLLSIIHQLISRQNDEVTLQGQRKAAQELRDYSVDFNNHQVILEATNFFQALKFSNFSDDSELISTVLLIVTNLSRNPATHRALIHTLGSELMRFSKSSEASIVLKSYAMVILLHLCIGNKNNETMPHILDILPFKNLLLELEKLSENPEAQAVIRENGGIEALWRLFYAFDQDIDSRVLISLIHLSEYADNIKKMQTMDNLHYLHAISTSLDFTTLPLKELATQLLNRICRNTRILGYRTYLPEAAVNVFENLTYVAEKKQCECFIVGSSIRSIVNEKRLNRGQDIDILLTWPSDDHGIIQSDLGDFLVKNGFRQSLYMPNLYQAAVSEHGQLYKIDCIIQPQFMPGKQRKLFNYVNDAFEKRDATQKCLFLRLDGLCFDPTGLGFQDLQNKILRSVIDPKVALAADPVQLLGMIKSHVNNGDAFAQNLKEAMEQWRLPIEGLSLQAKEHCKAYIRTQLLRPMTRQRFFDCLVHFNLLSKWFSIPTDLTLTEAWNSLGVKVGIEQRVGCDYYKILRHSLSDEKSNVEKQQEDVDEFPALLTIIPSEQSNSIFEKNSMQKNSDKTSIVDEIIALSSKEPQLSFSISTSQLFLKRPKGNEKEQREEVNRLARQAQMEKERREKSKKEESKEEKTRTIRTANDSLCMATVSDENWQMEWPEALERYQMVVEKYEIDINEQPDYVDLKDKLKNRILAVETVNKILQITAVSDKNWQKEWPEALKQYEKSAKEYGINIDTQSDYLSLKDKLNEKMAAIEIQRQAEEKRAPKEPLMLVVQNFDQKDEMRQKAETILDCIIKPRKKKKSKNEIKHLLNTPCADELPLLVDVSEFIEKSRNLVDESKYVLALKYLDAILMHKEHVSMPWQLLRVRLADFYESLSHDAFKREAQRIYQHILTHDNPSDEVKKKINERVMLFNGEEILKTTHDVRIKNYASPEEIEVALEKVNQLVEALNPPDSVGPLFSELYGALLLEQGVLRIQKERYNCEHLIEKNGLVQVNIDMDKILEILQDSMKHNSRLSHEASFYIGVLYKLVGKIHQFISEGAQNKQGSVTKNMMREYYDKAQHHFLQALKNAPDKIEIHWELAQVFEELEEFDKSKKHYQIIFEGNAAFKQQARVKIIDMNCKLNPKDATLLQQYAALVNESTWDENIRSKAKIYCDMGKVALSFECFDWLYDLSDKMSNSSTSVYYDLLPHSLQLISVFDAEESYADIPMLRKASNGHYFFNASPNGNDSLWVDVGDISHILSQYGINFIASKKTQVLQGYYPVLFKSLIEKSQRPVTLWIEKMRTILAVERLSFEVVDKKGIGNIDRAVELLDQLIQEYPVHLPCEKRLERWLLCQQLNASQKIEEYNVIIKVNEKRLENRLKESPNEVWATLFNDYKKQKEEGNIDVRNYINSINTLWNHSANDIEPMAWAMRHYNDGKYLRVITLCAEVLKNNSREYEASLRVIFACYALNNPHVIEIRKIKMQEDRQYLEARLEENPDETWAKEFRREVEGKKDAPTKVEQAANVVKVSANMSGFHYARTKILAPNPVEGSNSINTSICLPQAII